MKYYCGPDWMPEWALKIASIKFNASCKIHDLDYESPQKFTRLEADIRFLHHMMRQARGYLFWEIMALIYFLLARLAGRFSYG